MLDLRFVKPLDKDKLRELCGSHTHICVLSDSYAMGGVGSALLEFMAECNLLDVAFKSFEIQDSFIPHGNSGVVESAFKLDIQSITDSIKRWICV